MNRRERDSWMFLLAWAGLAVVMAIAAHTFA